MYRDFSNDKLNYLKSLTESGGDMPDMESLTTLSNPVMDIYNWTGKGEMPTTLKSSDLDAISKKIAGGDLAKTEFHEMFDKVFGTGEKSGYAPYDSLGDYSYRDTLVETEVQNTSRIQQLQLLALMEAEAEDDNIDEDNLRKLSADADYLKAVREDDEDDDEDDDDDDDDDDSLQEGYNLEEDYFDEDLVNEYVEESYESYDSYGQSPISLLENSEDDIVNLNTLLEQTQLIEDEVDSILGYDLSENSDDFSDVISDTDSILYEDFDDSLEESGEFDADLSDYLDEDIL